MKERTVYLIAIGLAAIILFMYLMYWQAIQDNRELIAMLNQVVDLNRTGNFHNECYACHLGNW